MDGGVPAGMRMPPGEAGCRTKRRRTRTITRHGKRSTNPRGIEMDELPFSRILRLKKANLETLRPFSRDESSSGRLGEEGSHFEIRCVKPIGASVRSEVVQRGSKRTPGSRSDRRGKQTWRGLEKASVQVRPGSDGDAKGYGSTDDTRTTMKIEIADFESSHGLLLRSGPR